MTTLFTILFDGVAYGMLLFVLACGLAVTLGLMNFVNLAHGAFAMTGGYVCAVLVNQSGWPFFAALPLAFVASALIGIVLERALYRHLYSRSHLDQVLFSVGLVFMSVAAVDYIMGSSRIFIKLPAVLEGQIDLFGVGIGRYRLMIIVICGLLTAAFATGAGAHALRLPASRRGRRSARCLRASASTCRTGVCLYLRVRVWPGRAGRRAERGDPRARSVFPAEIHDLLPDSCDGRRFLQHHRSVFSPRCCWGSAMSPANITCPRWDRSSSTRMMIVILIWRPNGLFGRSAPSR